MRKAYSHTDGVQEHVRLLTNRWYIDPHLDTHLGRSVCQHSSARARHTHARTHTQTNSSFEPLDTKPQCEPQLTTFGSL